MSLRILRDESKGHFKIAIYILYAPIYFKVLFTRGVRQMYVYYGQVGCALNIH